MSNASKYSLVAIPLLLMAAIPTFAQRPATGPAPSIDKTNVARARQQSESRREWQLRNFGRNPNASKDSREVKALIEQTEEDFNRILTRHNEFARLLASTQPFDYHFITEATAEIHKRATRLQSTLALEQLPEETRVVEKTDEIDAAHMKDALVKMCTQIRSFVTNPVIENPSTVDAQHLSTARRDLESMIQLSGHIKKESAKLDKKH
jgi:hypothetical protein